MKRKALITDYFTSPRQQQQQQQQHDNLNRDMSEYIDNGHGLRVKNIELKWKECKKIHINDHMITQSQELASTKYLDSLMKTIHQCIDILIENSESFQKGEWSDDMVITKEHYSLIELNQTKDRFLASIIEYLFKIFKLGGDYTNIIILRINSMYPMKNLKTGVNVTGGLYIISSETSEYVTDILNKFKGNLKSILIPCLRGWVKSKNRKEEIPTLGYAPKTEEFEYTLYYRIRKNNPYVLDSLITLIYLYEYPDRFNGIREITAYSYHLISGVFKPITEMSYMWVKNSFDLESFFGDITKFK